jgi:hypothetical protein
MAVTIRALKEKLAHLQHELAEVSAALDELDEPSPRPAASWTRPLDEVLREGVDYVDPRTLLSDFDAALEKMGLEIAASAPTAEEVQALMRREGVRPEDNLISRGVAEAREE